MNKAALLKIKSALLKKCHLKAENIPWGYARCFNDTCKRKDTCMHYLARVLTNQQERHIGQAVYPTAWQESECPCYMEKRLARKAWGVSRLYDNVPHYRKAEARQRVRSYFSKGMGPYYRFHHGENMLTPKQQDDIMQILAQFGSIEGIKFDHYETDWDFG